MKAAGATVRKNKPMGKSLDSYRAEYASLLDHLNGSPNRQQQQSVLPDGYRWVKHRPTNAKPKPRRYAPSPLRYAYKY